MIAPLLTLKELGTIYTGSTPKTGDDSLFGGDVPFVTPSDLGDVNPIQSTPRTLTELGVQTADLLPSESVLVCCIGSLGKIGFAGRPLVTNQQINAVVFNPTKVHARFGFYACRMLQPQLQLMAPATTVPIVNKSRFSELKIPVPPLDEQHRIAAILDQAETLRTQRRAALAQLDSLTQSIFLDMFGDPATNPKLWEKVPFSEVCETRLGKMLDAKQQTGQNRRRYLRNANVQWFRFDLSNLLEMDFDSDARETFSLRTGDLLICEGGEPGRAAIWQGQLEDVFYQKALHRGRPKVGIATPEYLNWLLWFLAHRGGLGDHVTTATIAHLTGEKLKAMNIPVPPLMLQKTFAMRIQAINSLKATHSAALAGLDALFASLQHRVFSGELTHSKLVTASKSPIRKRSFTELGQLDARKGVEALTYAAKRLRGKGHYWPTKVQCFADRHHLEHHGCTIYGETQMRMPHGPVPQAAFNASRALEKNELICEFPMDVVRTALRREGRELIALREADFAFLSSAERASLDWAIRYVADMTFDQLKTASHDAAWEKTPANAPIAWSDIIRTLPQAAQQRLFAEFE